MGNLNAQNADEIIDAYFETTGGKEAWRSLQGISMKGKMKIPMNNMEVKLTIVSLKDGRRFSLVNFQGQEMRQGVFDGTIMWGTNFMSVKVEEVDSEAVSNFKKNEAKDFPHPLLDYSKKGYSVKLLGKETVDGTECHMVQLTKNPVTVNGEEQNNIVLYYFDIESSVIIGMDNTAAPGGGMMGRMRQRSGQQGANQIAKVSDYQQVGGLYFPFSTSMGPGQLQLDEVVLNPSVDDDAFTMPQE